MCTSSSGIKSCDLACFVVVVVVPDKPNDMCSSVRCLSASGTCNVVFCCCSPHSGLTTVLQEITSQLYDQSTDFTAD